MGDSRELQKESRHPSTRHCEERRDEAIDFTISPRSQCP
jgi:hypothetical protein